MSEKTRVGKPMNGRVTCVACLNCARGCEKLLLLHFLCPAHPRDLSPIPRRGERFDPSNLPPHTDTRTDTRTDKEGKQAQTTTQTQTDRHTHTHRQTHTHTHTQLHIRGKTSCRVCATRRRGGQPRRICFAALQQQQQQQAASGTARHPSR